MKKQYYKICVQILVAVTFFSSCKYDDFTYNEFDHTAVYFAKQDPANASRTFIMEEGMQIKVGVVLGGKLENDRVETVEYVIPDTLVGALVPGYVQLPDSLYTIMEATSDSTGVFTVPVGKLQGFITIKVDSAKFVNDPLALQGVYAIPFIIHNPSTDSIVGGMNFTIIPVSYINQLYGVYYHKGTVDVSNTDTSYTEQNGVSLKNWELSMIAPDTVQANAVGNFGDETMKIAINYADNSLKAVGSIGGTVIIDNGGGSYDKTTRALTLNYTFEKNGSTFNSKTTLEFRNRVVDGFNQWGI